MHLTSPGYLTDIFFHRFAGEVKEHAHHLAVRTPSNPTYRWGHFLIMDAPPERGDLARWNALFARDVGAPPHITHRAFAWEVDDGENKKGENGDPSEFLAAGFELDEEVAMTAESLTEPRRPNREVTLRRLESDADFAQQLRLHAESWESRDDASYRDFYRLRIESYRRMIAAGLGHWFGAFSGATLVADMGLFKDGASARFQSVVTHPAYRRRGICGTLLHYAGHVGLTELGAAQLVIVAEENYFAKDLYATLGFRTVARQAGLISSPPPEKA